MKIILKPLECLALLENILNYHKISYARVHQFKIQKPVYYPNRQQETKRMQEQFKNQLVPEKIVKKDLPRDYYYKLLNVPKNASTNQIKAAYYALAKRHHPDAITGKQQVSKPFQDILNAYHCLADEAKRQEYDILEGSKTETQSSIPKDFEDNSIAITNHEDLRKIAKDDLKLELTFLEAVQGLKKNVYLKCLKKCPGCNGKSQHAIRNSNMEQCRRCYGTGQLSKRTTTYTSLTVCDQCNGKRYIDRNQCDMCDSRGFLLDTATVTVNVPIGSKTGDIISVANPRTKQRLNYTIQVKASDQYKRVDNNVHSDKHITISEAVLGGTFKVRGVYEDLDVKIEPGTESHTQLKLKGKGIKSRDGVGDHIITVKIKIPRQLSVKQRQLILALAKVEKPIHQPKPRLNTAAIIKKLRKQLQHNAVTADHLGLQKAIKSEESPMYFGI
uniref:J domain-containing protein n=1 Tax=Glossina brevipalpis TaxID=37001 RepID=A0A1A9WHK8_9MUSC